MLFGKLKNSSVFGFGVFEENFISYVEIDDDEHMAIVEKANRENKIIAADDNGYPVLKDRPQPSEAELAQSKIDEQLHYLEQTDWYVLRFIEEGIEIPNDVKEKRHSARAEISKLREHKK